MHWIGSLMPRSQSCREFVRATTQSGLQSRLPPFFRSALAQEISDRDRVIRIARREGATLRALAEATGLSRQTIANICAAGGSPARKRTGAS